MPGTVGLFDTRRSMADGDMDGSKFDDLMRAVGRGTTRRGVAKALVALILGGGTAIAGSEMSGAQVVRRSKCRPARAGCSRGVQCCSGLCDTNRSLPRSQRNRCVCIPECSGKICGPDACGSTCGACEAGETCCGGGEWCANLQTDEENCGTCGNTCDTDETCCAGSCRKLNEDEANCGACGTTCNAGETCCTGFCKNLNDDEANCGTCGTACNAGETCCTGDCADLTSDEAHCGSCGDACGAGETCCNTTCYNLQTDESHCGDCDTVCDTGYSCTSGTCECGGTTCSTGLTCCSDTCVDLKTDEDNCLACGTACGELEYCERLYNLGCTTICQEGGSKFGFYDTDLNFYDGFTYDAYYQHYVVPINANGDLVPSTNWQACTTDSQCDANCPSRLTWSTTLDKPVVGCGCNRIFCLSGNPSDHEGNGYCVAYA
jgi:hypothetical protein